MTVYHETAHRPYVVIPAITLLLEAIAANCAVGGSFAPGVRQLAEWANISQGIVSSNLWRLHGDGWISYDGHVIRLLRSIDRSIDQADDAIDRSIDQAPPDAIDPPIATDRSIDRSVPSTTADRDATPKTTARRSDRSIDRSLPHMVYHDLAAAAESKISAAAISLKLPCADENDRSIDRSPTDLLLVELGCESAALRAEILAHYPDLTPAQLSEQWALAQERERDGYAGNARRLLFGTLRNGGWLYGRTVDRTQPVTAADLPPPLEPDQQAMHAAYHRARGLAPPGLPHALMSELIYALLDGATDDQARDLIAAGGAA